MSTTPPQIVLYQPEIPPNTGNIIRLSANTGAQLHLIRPFGFEWDDTRLRRAGLDYHDLAHVTLHDSLDEYLREASPERVFACTTKGARSYGDIRFAPGDALLYGPETRGLPDDILNRFSPDMRVRIPMQKGSRSLNLANAVAVIMYEAWRQMGFPGGD